MPIVAASTPPISEELFVILEEVFGRPYEPSPNVSTMDEIMYAAGQRSVVEWIRHHAVRKAVKVGPTTVDVDIRDHRTT